MPKVTAQTSDLYGTAQEPVGTGKPASPYELMHAYQFYNQHGSANNAAEVLKTTPALAERFLTLAWTERMLTRQFVLDGKANDTLLQMRSDFEALKNQKDATAEARPKVNPIEATKAKALSYLGDIEVQMDSLRHNGLATTVFNWFEFISNLGVKSAHVPTILAEIEVEKTRLEHPEAFDPVVVDLQRLSQNKSVVRRAPKTKVLKAEKIVGKLQFAARSDEYKVESIAPEAVLKGEGLWVFNTKYRDLIYYQGSGGIGISGTTLKNVDLDKSFRKVLRKPLDVLPQILAGTKKQNAKLFAELSGKACKVSARINKDCILLKVEK